MNASLTKTRFTNSMIAAALATLLASSGADAGRAPFKAEHEFQATCWSTNVVVTGMDGPTTTSHITGICYENSLGMLTLDAYQHVTSEAKRPLGGMIQPVSIFATSVYTTASGDALNALFAGGGTINFVTGAVDFGGLHSFAGGTGRFLAASGSAVVVRNARPYLPTDGLLQPHSSMVSWDYVVVGTVNY